MGSGKPPVQLHAGDCHMPGARRRPISRSEARDVLTAGLQACTHRQPDIRLNVRVSRHGDWPGVVQLLVSPLSTLDVLSAERFAGCIRDAPRADIEGK
ncbi:DUF6233 domain-containing protein [Streptomyces krungchingensis]